MAATGQSASWYAAQGAEAVELLALGLDKSSSLKASTVAQNIASVKSATFMGPTNFNASHFNIGLETADMLIQQQQPGPNGVKIIYPAAVANGQFQKPTC
jgi:ABC-type branched-subunit amino acid transport system substrate-binding protein